MKTELRVEVRCRFDGSWVGGFEVVDEEQAPGPDQQYRLRRTSDGVVLPALFAAEDVRPSLRDRQPVA